MKRFIQILFAASLGVTGTVGATDIIHYENMPVTIELNVNQERSVAFGDHVQVGLTKGQQIEKLFRVQSAQGIVHFLPYKAFDKQRLQIKRMTDGRIILLDLIARKAKKGAPELEDVKVVLDVDNKVDDPDSFVEKKDPIVTPVDLTRFVSQKLYGPTRLQKDVPGIVETTLKVKGYINIFKNKNKYNTLSRPVVAYQGGGYYIAGIYIKNISSQPIQLSYTDINIPFSHATFQHHSLKSQGVMGDSTVLYLVSAEPLSQTLYPWTYYQDQSQAAQMQAEKEAAEEARAKKAKYGPRK
jgi:integrating conjugative element protein (TIGR03749 family)